MLSPIHIFFLKLVKIVDLSKSFWQLWLLSTTERSDFHDEQTHIFADHFWTI